VPKKPRSSSLGERPAGAREKVAEGKKKQKKRKRRRRREREVRRPGETVMKKYRHR